MKIIKKSIFIVLIVTGLSALFWGCSYENKKKTVEPIFTWYRDIPGVTSEEIDAINALCEQTEYFVYGMPLSIEAFKNEDGEISGFSAMFCDWLTGLFGIPFKPAIYELQDLFSGLASGDISFSGELTITEDRLKVFYMTSALISRPVKYFRLEGAESLSDIAKERLVRCGFINGAATISAILAELTPGTYEIVLLDDFSRVYDALTSGRIDAFYYSGTAEVNFINYSDVGTYNFYPLIRMPVSLATQNEALIPVISVVEKALQSGAARYLIEMYNKSFQDYTRHKLFSKFTDEELAYIENSSVIPFSAEHDNYPTSFFDVHIKKWTGIGFDVLHEIADLTGLNFSIAHTPDTGISELVQMLDNGDSFLHIELDRLTERNGRYLWPKSYFKIDNPALISQMDQRGIDIHEIYSVKVGLTKGITYTEMFHKWFPNHNLITEYESQNESFDALMRGDVAMVMNSYSGLLYLTHYLERTGYKINYLFDYPYYCTFGFNRDQEILCSIIDKALGIIDTYRITNQWMTRT